MSMLTACRDSSVYDLNCKYANSDEIDTIFDLRSKETQLIEHRIITYIDSSFVIITFNASGKMVDSSYSDKKGRYQGKRRIILEDGNLKFLSYKDGKKNGEALLFDESGGLIKVGHFNDNKADGEWIDYYSSGLPKKYEFLTSKGITFQRTFDSNGTIDLDRGHPLTFKKIGDGEKPVEKIIVATPPLADIRIFEFRPVDSSVVRELFPKDGIIKFHRESFLSTDSIIYLKWELYKEGTDLLQREGFGKFDGTYVW
ncbi:toxin-antitoxin system YwqK family antitoxin [Owenweeksia hongkongensis]|uniref:toxin-antitoxin system YwqK family antitoxin n=1 Tax=Owenweeksia hongkongensis TaxID=253245 RepID=UPI003A90B950